MKPKPIPHCSQHRVPKEWRKTTFEYRDQNITVQVPRVYAWVCPVDGEASFTPETMHELITTVRDFFETAKRAKNRYSELREYIISVG